MTTSWKPPKGFVLTEIPGHYVNNRGFQRDPANPARPDRPVMADSQTEVLHWNEDEPFVLSANDGKGPHASVEARKAALAGDPIMGWNPNAIALPIEDGWVPTSYTLTAENDPTPVTEPAIYGPLTAEQEAAALRAGIAAAEARIAELEGGAS